MSDEAVGRGQRMEELAGLREQVDLLERSLGVERPDQEALAEHAARFRSLFNGLNEPVFVHPLKAEGFHGFIEVNDTACRNYGYTREEFLRLSPLDITTPDDARGKGSKTIRDKLLKDGHCTFEVTHLTRDGLQFPVEISSNTFRSQGRDVILTIARDITVRRQAEENRRRYEQIISATDDHMSFVDQDYIYQAVNDVYLKAHAMTRESIVGHTVAEVMGEEVFRTVIKENLDRALAGEEIRYSAWFDFVGIGHRFADVSYKPVRGTEGQMTGVVVTGHDNTAHRRIEQELRLSETRLRAAQRVGAIGSWELDRVTNEVWWSEETYRLFGLTPEGFGGTLQDFFALIHPEDRDAVGQAYTSSVESQTDYEIVHRVVDGNGGTRYFREHCVTEYDESGHPRRSVGTVQDVTARVAAEEERESLQAQLLQSQKLESIGRLAGGVAHDFNNMLSVIRGHVDLALQQLDVAHPVHADLRRIDEAARGSADLTRQLLAFACRQTAEPRVLDLNDTLENTLSMLRRLIGEGIDLVWKPGAGLWPVRVDPNQITQILTNLCINARDAIGDVGRITIETDNRTLDTHDLALGADCRPGAFTVLAVSDDGVGMEPEIIAQIFEPFFTTKEVGQGTGLGLATVYGTVKQNGGFVTVDSEPGVGTTFLIHLPRHEGEVEVEESGGQEAAIPRGNETVLVVEDDDGILAVVDRMLSQLGYRVLMAATPGDAIRLLGDHDGEIDLVISDVVMPEMNGWKLVRKLAEIQPGLRTLFMSGYTADVIADHGILEEGVNFISKLFGQRELGFRVREVLAGGG